MHQFCSPQVVSWDKFTCSNSFEPSFDSNSKLFEPPLPVLQCIVCIICNPYYRLIKSKFSLVSTLSCPGCRFDFLTTTGTTWDNFFIGCLGCLSCRFILLTTTGTTLDNSLWLLSLLSLLSKLSFYSFDDNRDNFFICCLANAFPT